MLGEMAGFTHRLKDINSSLSALCVMLAKPNNHSPIDRYEPRRGQTCQKNHLFLSLVESSTTRNSFLSNAPSFATPTP